MLFAPSAGRRKIIEMKAPPWEADLAYSIEPEQL
jgi:hypothetical protein